MKAIALRRTKDMQVDGKRLVELPRKTISMHYVDLSPEDREVYDKVEEIGKEVIEGYMKSGTVLQNYASVLQIILRLRQICDHTGLCPAYTEMLTAELNQQGRLFLSFMVIYLGHKMLWWMTINPKKLARLFGFQFIVRWDESGC